MSVEERLAKLERDVTFLLMVDRLRVSGQAAMNAEIVKYLVAQGQDKPVAETPMPARSIAGLLNSKIESKLLEKIDISEDEDAVIVRPKEYLGGENFKKIHDVVGPLKGEWISEGKKGYWRIPKAT